MSANAVETEAPRSCAGRMAVVVWRAPGNINHKCYVGNVVDFNPEDPTKPKRVRIQQDLCWQGQVLMPGDYTFKCWVDEEAD
ncbi:hypothetical protein CCP3SC15_3330003 [Gammaproteobacteria bacterium]